MDTETMNLLRLAAEPTWDAVQLMAGVKSAMVPIPQGQMPPPPMDPGMAGMPPMDPGMGAAPPGGMPPMDPTMGGMPPMDPAMGGMPPPPADPAAAMGGLGGMGPLPPEQLADMPGGAPGGPGDPAAEQGALEDKLMQAIEQKFDELSKKLGVQPTGGTGPAGGGGKAKTEEAIARLQSTLDKMVAYFGGKDGKPLEQVVAESQPGGDGSGTDMSALADVMQGGLPEQKTAMIREFKSKADEVMAAFTELMGGS